MSRTYISIRCPKCNYSYNTSVGGGYSQDPIGMPLMMCPHCNNILRNHKCKEWIQMSPIKKFFSISTGGGNLISFFLALILPICIFSSLSIEPGGIVPWAICAVSWFFIYYIIVSIQINRWKCLDRIISSMLRTKNESYANLLCQIGKTYGCEIPKILYITKANKTLIDDAIKNYIPANITIPTFGNSINNY